MSPTAAAALPAARRPSVLGVGTVLFLASELMFFSALFAAYFTLRTTSGPWPPGDVHLSVARVALFTAVLVSSSATMHVGVRAAEHGDRGRTLRWTLLTVGLGAAFLVNQALEYAELGFGISSHAYGSMFYLMTGFHGLHVLVGLVAIGIVLAVGTGATSRAPLGEQLTVTEYYWHFVDVVWVAMFTSLYLLR
jgi:cytochrome c oxidase subunit 3